jgi:type II secretory ATPase GspE/PulE/Tfp pilus assembly ATPase PilB-like protein
MFHDQFTTAKDYLDHLMAQAIMQKASDVHIEHRASGGLIRIRAQGDMRVLAELPQDRMSLLIRRIKFISGLDPERSGNLGEGRFEFDHGGQKIIMRLSILPTNFADDLVIRILGSAPEVFGLSQMNFDPLIQNGLREAVQKSMGLMLVTGPTGSGKTSTLYAAIQEINDGSYKIVTVEDPIEYKVEGLTQIKVDPRYDITYASVLRGALRHDPDVILIGECRELAAAEIAIEASMTGHMVLTTLHTNNAVSSILRLINLGIQPIDVANAMTVAYAQRLIRKLCPVCKQAHAPDETMRARYSALRGKKIFSAKGCESCQNSGYNGRMPVGELLQIDDDIRDVIIQSPSLGALNRIAAAKGLRTMADYGMQLVIQGDLSYHDVVNSVT